MKKSVPAFTRALLFSMSMTLPGIAISDEAKRAATTAQRMPVVNSIAGSLLTEEQPADETGRPEWTGARRFAGTRVYIQKAPWEVGVESWWQLKHRRDGTTAHRLLQEVEIGLPGRMQLGLYTDH